MRKGTLQNCVDALPFSLSFHPTLFYAYRDACPRRTRNHLNDLLY